MSVRTWFTPWIKRHRELLPRADWPAPGSAMYSVWLSTLEREHVTETEANTASERMVADPPHHLDGHIPQLLVLVRGTRQKAGVAVPGTRDEAIEASRGCVECGGGGLTRRKFATRRNPTPAWHSCYCHRCPHGRWLKDRHSTEDTLRGRIIDLADYPHLHHVDEPEPGEHRRWDRDAKAFIGGIGKIPPVRRPDPNDERNRQLEYLEHRKRVADFSSPPPF